MQVEGWKKKVKKLKCENKVLKEKLNRHKSILDNKSQRTSLISKLAELSVESMTKTEYFDKYIFSPSFNRQKTYDRRVSNTSPTASQNLLGMIQNKTIKISGSMSCDTNELNSIKMVF